MIAVQLRNNAPGQNFRYNVDVDETV